MTGSGSRAGPARNAFHVFLALLAWLGFAALWAWQLAVHVPERWLESLALIAALLLVWALFVPAWVAWNRSIYRRRHRRTTPLRRDPSVARDALGRVVVAPRDLQITDGQIAVSVLEPANVKLYMPLHREPTSSPLALPRPTPSARSSSNGHQLAKDASVRA